MDFLLFPGPQLAAGLNAQKLACGKPVEIFHRLSVGIFNPLNHIPPLRGFSWNNVPLYCKGVAKRDCLLDFMGREELAANLFRITQTEARIKNENARGQQQLEQTAYQVVRKVRKTMEEISSTRPGSLPISEGINLVKRGLKKAQKKSQNWTFPSRKRIAPPTD